jgi:hypothetical protein
MHLLEPLVFTNTNNITKYPIRFLQIAVSYAIRTSLGPRGMDKMVNLLLYFICTIWIVTLL